MELVLGWSTQYANHKFSIGVNETDFLQIMAEQGISEEQAAKVSFFDKFRLLEVTARYLSESESLRVITEPNLREQAQASADAARAEVGTCLQGIKAKLGAAGEPVPGD